MEIGDGEKSFNLNMEETANNFEADILGFIGVRDLFRGR